MQKNELATDKSYHCIVLKKNVTNVLRYPHYQNCKSLIIGTATTTKAICQFWHLQNSNTCYCCHHKMPKLPIKTSKMFFFDKNKTTYQKSIAIFQPKETLDERQVKHHHCSATSLCKKTHNFLHSFKVFYQASQNSYKRQALPKYFNTNKKLGL